MSVKKQPVDYVLILMILFLTVGSGITTIQGASQILPSSGIGMLVGIGFQTILFLLLTNLILKTRPTYKFSLVAILMSFSIYTSFFSYYEKLSSSNNAHIAYDRAVKAHQVFVSKVFSPLDKKLKDATEEKKNYEVQKDKEISGKGATLEKGTGSEARQYAEKSVAADGKIASLQFVNGIRSHFEYSTQDLKGEEILRKDREALSKVPPDMLPSTLKSEDLINRNDYIDDISNVKFLLPITKVKEGDQTAKMSLVISSLVEITMLILSGAVDSKKSRRFKIIAIALSKYIFDFKSMIVTIKEALNLDGMAFSGNNPTSFNNDELTQEMEYISICLTGKVTSFLETVTLAIDVRTLVFDVDSLLKHSNPSYKAAVLDLVHELRAPHRQWCFLNENGSFIMEDAHFNAFRQWIREEKRFWAEDEQTSKGRQTAESGQQRNVRIGIPSMA
jgi:hypothetical protein